MDRQSPAVHRGVFSARLLLGVATTVVLLTGVILNRHRIMPAPPPAGLKKLAYQPRKASDTGGFNVVLPMLKPWPREASLAEIATQFRGVGQRDLDEIDRMLDGEDLTEQNRIVLMFMKASLYLYDNKPERCYETLEEIRSWLDSHDATAEQWLYTVIYYQGVAGLRRGETENCIACRGESSCILPIAPAAVHTNPAGSRLAIRHFTEYLERFPDDLGVRWLLNVAHMTLGEYPEKVDSRHVISFDHFLSSEFDIGRFRDVGADAGVDRFNQAGGAVMDDFDGDGRLDLAVTAMDPTQPMSFYHNRGDGTFEDRSESAGVTGQLGGLVCYQTDYNNDGRLDLFVPRGAWLPYPIRPSLLRNDGGGRFTDVTTEARLARTAQSQRGSLGRLRQRRLARRLHRL